MSKTRNNHYVPQWYQKGFFEPGRNTLQYLDLDPPQKILDDGRVIIERATFEAPTSRCFRHMDLYLTFFGTAINDEIERKLFGAIDATGSKAIRAFCREDVAEWHRHFQTLFEFIDIQKIRTPKGLDWLKEQYPELTQNELMYEMQGIRMMHCTIWSEGVREIVSAEAAGIKFLVSDHPVTIYNHAVSPKAQGCSCRGPGHAVVAADGAEAHLVEVAAVFPDRLELAAPVGVDLADPLVAPARRGLLTAPLEVERSRRPHRSVTATFTLADGAAPGASPYSTHLGLDVLTDPTVLRQPLRTTLGQTVEQVDNGFGPIVLEPVRSYLQGRATITTVDYGAAARWARRRWLLSLHGRQRAFWLPGWGRELVLQAPIAAADTSMVVTPIGDLDAYGGRHVMIELGSGIFREVTGASFDALGHRLTIAAPGVAVPVETPVHWMTKVRLDADRVELVHLATRTEMSATVIEVPA